MKTTAGAIEAKNGAIKLIRDNVEKIYDDFIVNEMIDELRWDYYIKPDLYTKHEKDVSTITDIDELVYFLNDKWLDQIREDEKTATTSESIVRLNILIENREKGRAEESGIIWPTQEYFKSANNNFLKEAVKNIMKGSFYLFKRINIDPDLWRGVITAMLLRVPIEKVLACEESILTKYFLPTIDNDHLIIKINELTKVGDLDLIFDLVEAKQSDYTAKHGYVNSTGTLGYPSRKADRIITKCSRRGFSLDEIHAELEKEGITRKYDKAEIRERIEEYLEQTRQTWKPADKIKFA